MGPYATSASLAISIFLTALSSVTRAREYGRIQWLPVPTAAPTPTEPRRTEGCGVQYEPGKQLTQVRDPRLQAVFLRLLARFEITEPVLLCADIPLGQKNFAETVRRSDGRAVVAISNLLLEFTDDEVAGMLAHELAHLLAGDPERPRPATTDEYLQEERNADIKAAERVGCEAVCAAVRRAYRMSVALGFESKTNVLRHHRDRRLKWIMDGGRCTLATIKGGEQSPRSASASSPPTNSGTSCRSARLRRTRGFQKKVPQPHV